MGLDCLVRTRQRKMEDEGTARQQESKTADADVWELRLFGVTNAL